MENSQDRTALTTPAFVVKQIAENPLQVINSLHFCWRHISRYLPKPDFSCLYVLQPWESDCCCRASLPSGGKQDYVKRRGNESSYNMLKPSCVLIAPAFAMANFFNSVQTEEKRREEKGFHPLQFASTRECATNLLPHLLQFLPCWSLIQWSICVLFNQFTVPTDSTPIEMDHLLQQP